MVYFFKSNLELFLQNSVDDPIFDANHYNVLLNSIFNFHTFSHDLQTCDWPRNVVCVQGKRSGFDADDEDHERVPKILVEDVNFGLKKSITPKASVPVSDE